MDPLTLLWIFGGAILAKKITSKVPSPSKAIRGYEIIQGKLKVNNEKQALNWAFDYGKTIKNVRLTDEIINKLLFNFEFGKIVNLQNYIFLMNLIHSLLNGTIYFINEEKISQNDYYKLVDNYYLENLFIAKILFYLNSKSMGEEFYEIMQNVTPNLNLINKGYRIESCEFIQNNDFSGNDIKKFIRTLSELITEKNLEHREELFYNIVSEWCGKYTIENDPIRKYIIRRIYLQGLVKNNLMSPADADDLLTNELDELKDNFIFDLNNKIHEKQFYELNELTNSIYDTDIT